MGVLVQVGTGEGYRLMTFQSLWGEGGKGEEEGQRDDRRQQEKEVQQGSHGRI